MKLQLSTAAASLLLLSQSPVSAQDAVVWRCSVTESNSDGLSVLVGGTYRFTDTSWQKSYEGVWLELCGDPGASCSRNGPTYVRTIDLDHALTLYTFERRGAHEGKLSALVSPHSGGRELSASALCRAEAP